jgi:hypothetical protein
VWPISVQTYPPDTAELLQRLPDPFFQNIEDERKAGRNDPRGCMIRQLDALL